MTYKKQDSSIWQCFLRWFYEFVSYLLTILNWNSAQQNVHFDRWDEIHFDSQDGESSLEAGIFENMEFGCKKSGAYLHLYHIYPTYSPRFTGFQFGNSWDVLNLDRNLEPPKMQHPLLGWWTMVNTELTQGRVSCQIAEAFASSSFQTRESKRSVKGIEYD